MAGVERLERWVYEEMIDKFATRYSLNPDFVADHTTFDTISLFLCKWTEESEYQDSYSELEKQMTQTPTK